MHLRFNRLSLGLALACGLVTVALGLELSLRSHPSADSDDVRLSSLNRKPVEALPSYIPPAFGFFTEVLNRPLFFADRKLPPGPVVPTIVAETREPLRLSLEGIAIADTSKVALLRDLDSDTMVQMAEGMAHNGWTLESLQSEEAVFRRGDETASLKLETAIGARRRRR